MIFKNIGLFKKLFFLLFLIFVLVYLTFYIYQVEVGEFLIDRGIYEDCKGFNWETASLENSDNKVAHYLKKEGVGVPIVILPGGSMEASMLCPFAEVFKDQKRPLFIFENPGHGKAKVASAKVLREEVLSGKHWVLSYAKHFQNLLQKIKIKKFDLIGYSLGGGSGALLVGEIPEKIGKAIFVAPAGFSMVYTKSFIKVIKEGRLKETYAWESLEEFESLLEYIHMDHKQIPIFLKKSIVKKRLKYYGEGYWDAYFNSYKNIDITYPDKVLKVLLKGKKLPPILVVGLEKDKIIDINKLPHFSRLLDGEFVKVIGSGHAGHSKKTPLIKSFFLGLSPLMNKFLDSSDAEHPKVLGPINF